MRLIDLSQPVFDGAPNCPSHPPVHAEVIEWHVPSGKETWHLELLKFSTHTGSHVDAPLHKFPGGTPLDGIPLEHWRGKARIVDFRGIAPHASITAAMLTQKLGDGSSLRDAYCLLATGWGQKRGKTQEWLHDAPSLGADGAAWLVAHGARGVGIDHWSIGSAATHATLLAKPVLIVEELFFPEEVFSIKDAEFWALPINLRGMSGAPCRPVLVVPDAVPTGSVAP